MVSINNTCKIYFFTYIQHAATHMLANADRNVARRVALANSMMHALKKQVMIQNMTYYDLGLADRFDRICTSDTNDSGNVARLKLYNHYQTTS